MSVVIVFPNGSDWFYANRFYRRLLSDLKVGEPGVSELLERGSDHNALFLNDMPPTTALSIVRLFAEQCDAIASRTLAQPAQTDAERLFAGQYPPILRELAQLARRQLAEWPPQP